MDLIKWEPMLRRMEDSLWRDFFRDLRDLREFERGANLIEKENEFVLEIELPGYRKEDIKVDVSEDSVRGSAKY